MRYANIITAVGAAVLLVGCASAPRVAVDEPLGPAPATTTKGTGDGSIVIYSARTPADVDMYQDEWRWNNDFGKNAFLYEPAHSDYTIYTQNGHVFKHVRNSRDPNDDTPTVVKLPAGSYKVEAEAVNCDGNQVAVLLPVVVKPGQATVAHLEGDWNPVGQFGETHLAKLPCGRVIGWRAPETGYAAAQPSH